MNVAAMSSEEAAKAIAVVFPDIGEPYRGMFSAIIAGVEDRLKRRVLSLPVSGGSAVPDLLAELRQRDVQGVIALGRQGLKLASGLERQFNVLAAGVLSVPEAESQGFPIYSLAPEPGLLFGRLRALMPQGRRIMTVCDPRQNAWLMRLARDAARAHGFEFQSWEVDDLRGAVKAYQDALGAADAKRDALWLPQDTTTVEDSAVLPLVLRESWERNLTVFSSSLAHVKRGALFALYPNNHDMGRALATAMLAQLAQSGAGGASAVAGVAGPNNRGMQPLRDLLLAVNTRTASHLGLNLGASSLRFSMSFPEP
jgi:putative ABC transport system substrate-binding protein